MYDKERAFIARQSPEYARLIMLYRKLLSEKDDTKTLLIRREIKALQLIIEAQY